MRRWSVAALVLLSLANAGCLVVAAGAAGYGAVKYAKNEASRDYHASLDATWVAMIDTMNELGYPVAPGTPHGPTSGSVSVNGASVSVAKHNEQKTRVAARFGTFDNDSHRRMTILLFDGIARRLGQP